MNKYILLIMLSFLSYPALKATGETIPVSSPEPFLLPKQDTLERQLLVNGRIWRNSYLHIDGHQFLYAKEFLPGTVTVNGRIFSDKSIKLKLDICNDELLTVTGSGTVVQLNKELVNSFTLEYGNKNFSFKKLEAESINNLNGYVQVIYSGETALYVKHKKEVRLRTSVGEKDTFIETYRIFVMKDGIANLIKSKSSLLRILDDRKDEIKNYLRSNKIRISKSTPDSFRPALQYYDTLK